MVANGQWQVAPGWGDHSVVKERVLEDAGVGQWAVTVTPADGEQRGWSWHLGGERRCCRIDGTGGLENRVVLSHVAEGTRVDGVGGGGGRQGWGGDTRTGRGGGC